MQRNLLFLVALLLLCPNAYGDFLGPFKPQAVQPVLAKWRNSKPDTSRVVLALQLSDLYFYRANRTAAELDSALFYTTAAEKLGTSLTFDKGLAMVYFQQAAIFPLVNLRDKGQKAIARAVELFSRQKDYRMLGESYYRESGYFSLSESEIGERIKYASLSRSAFRKGGYIVKEATVLQAIGETYFVQGNSGMALTYLKQSLQTYQSAKYDQLMGIYDLLGVLYTELGSPEEGIRYGMLALRTAQTLKDTSLQLSTIYNRIGITYYNLNEYKKAIENYDNGLKISEKFGDIASIHIIASNKAHALLRLREYHESLHFLNKIEAKYPATDINGKFFLYRVLVATYMEMRQYDKTTKYINSLLEMAAAPMPTGEYSEKIYHLLVDFYVRTGDYAKAAKYIKLHRVLADQRKYSQMAYMNLFWQSKLDSVNHRYLAALGHFQQYSALKDSIFNDKKSRQISQLEIIYDTEKKEENIRLLKRESVLHQKMLRQASFVQNITYVSISLLLIIIGLLIYGYRLVKKNNKALATRQEEINNKNISLGRLLKEKEWLVKEIHHRVKNNLHMIVGLLESQSEFLKGDEAKVALTESEHRIQSMSMIHQKLYQTDNLTSIEISPYIHELVRYLEDSFETKSPVQFNLDIEQLEMNISHSIPLGLILNEAIINALKYAFPNGREGIIDISFKQTRPHHFLLTVSDNGIGLAPGFYKQKIDSFGLTLIRGLCDDLAGKLDIISNQGTTIQISFDYIAEEKDVGDYSYV